MPVIAALLRMIGGTPADNALHDLAYCAAMGSSAADAGERVERAVIALLLAFDGPDELAIDEIVDEIGNRRDVMGALAKLEYVGLVERVGGSIRPTPAARRFDELDI